MLLWTIVPLNVSDQGVNMTFSTGEFQIPRMAGVDATYKRTACIFDGHLHTVNQLSSGQMFFHHVTFDLNNLTKMNPGKDDTGTQLIDVKALKDDSNWQWEEVFNYALGANFVSGVELTATPKKMFMFYAYNYGDYSLLRVKTIDARDPDPTKQIEPPKWSQEFTILFPGGKENVPGFSGAISATTFGENQVIVAMPAKSVPGETDQHFDLLLLDVDDLDPEKSLNWIARSARKVSLEKEAKYYVNGVVPEVFDVHSSDINVDLDWFATISENEKSDPKDDKGPNYHLAVSVALETATPTEHSDAAMHERLRGGRIKQTFARENFSTVIDLPLHPDGSGRIDDTNGKTFGSGVTVFNSAHRTLETGLARDPAGRLRSFILDDAVGGIAPVFANTSIAPALENEFGSKLAPIYPIRPQIQTKDRKTRPAGAFHLYENGKSEKKSDTSGIDNIVTMPALEFLLYGDGKCVLREYGTINVIETTRQLDSKPEQEGETYIVGGYFDSPIPFPKANFIGKLLPNSIGTEVGDFSFANQEKVEFETRTSTDWTVGFEAGGKTTKGVGPAWKVSLDGGMGSVESKSKDTSYGKTMRVGASVTFTKDKNGDEEYEISGQGYASLLQATIHLAGYEFRDADGVLINGILTKDPGVSEKIAQSMITIGPAEHVANVLPPILTTVGDLESYKPEMINERMFKQFGGTKHYFEEVLYRNALPIASGQPMLLFNWSGSERTDGSFEVVDTKFLERSWEFSGSVYAGVSGGFEAEFFGLGVGYEAEFLAGGTYSSADSVAGTKAVTWGLELAEDWGPPEAKRSKEVGAVESYDFAALYLPSPQKPSKLDKNFWAMELQRGLEAAGSKVPPTMIDPNSGCWRVVFVVTRIEYVDPERETYIYKHPDNVPLKNVYE